MCDIIVSGQLTMHQVALSDADEIFKIIDTQREYLGRWLPFVGNTHSVEDTRTFIRSLVEAPEGQGEPVFVIRFDGALAGLVGFKGSDRFNRRTEIGYWLSESFQGRGIMTSSVKALLRYAFGEMGMNRVQIRCGAGNLPSIGIPQRLGFKFEGIERAGEWLPNQGFINLEVYSLLAGEQIDG
ncbi:MAG: GNAT family N-acetyltransferase [Bacteroidales bacterium]|nr:GNAT family N-acetyltransferase [Bacteroidales bacterium]